MTSPFTLPPPLSAQSAAAEVTERMHTYMRKHPESELHRQGKMFGVLVYDRSNTLMEGGERNYLAAFSAQLDGSNTLEGFVPPVYEAAMPPVGTNREESRRLQQLLFAQYRFTNGRGENKNLLEIFAREKPILPAEEWFDKSASVPRSSTVNLPPSGAGECCAPKLLQYALTHGLQPVAMAEFWVGAPSRTEIRREGVFYAPCSGKCVPILRHMLQGLEVGQTPQMQVAQALCEQVQTVYEDEWLTVVNKPAGLLSVPGKTEELSVESYLSLHSSDIINHPPLKAVHRLDQDTSGLLVLAKTAAVYKELQAYFQRRDILKRYEAVILPNHPSSLICLQPEGEIRLPLLPDPYDRPRQTVDMTHGKPSITRYHVRERRADGSLLVNLFPLTGRTHQLRVHAAHPEGLNAPIVGDRLYGQADSKRLMLHAAEILFVHPVTQKKLHFCIPSGF